MTYLLRSREAKPGAIPVPSATPPGSDAAKYVQDTMTRFLVLKWVICIHPFRLTTPS